MSLEHPAYWFIYVPESTETGPPEVAAVAPEAAPTKLLGPDARGLFIQLQRFHQSRPAQRIVFAGELLGWLRSRGFDWHAADIDIFDALRDLDEHAPALLIEASPITMAVVVDSAEAATIHYTGGDSETIHNYVEPARAAIFDILERDWAPWVRRVLHRAHNGHAVD